MTPYLTVSDIIKNAVYGQRRTFIKTFAKEKNMTLQANCQKYKHELSH